MLLLLALDVSKYEFGRSLPYFQVSVSALFENSPIATLAVNVGNTNVSLAQFVRSIASWICAEDPRPIT